MNKLSFLRNIFDLLLKFHGASHISSVNLIACTGTLCNIAKVRPALFPAVVEALKTLHANLPPTLTNSQVSTVRKHLKMQFLNLVKQPMDQSRTYYSFMITKHTNIHFIYIFIDTQAEIIFILKDLGCNEAELKRNIPNRNKRPLVVEDLPSKRQRTSKHPLTAVEPTEEAITKSNVANEAFVSGKLDDVEKVIELVVSGMDSLPQEMPSNFLVDYTPIGDLSVPDQVKRISKLLAKQMTMAKVGPGTTYLTAPPVEEPVTKVESKTEDSARHLKETLERMKGYVNY